MEKSHSEVQAEELGESFNGDCLRATAVPYGITRGSRAAEISNRAVQVLHEYTGRGPTRAHTVVNRDSVLILVGDTLTKGERTLVATGQVARMAT